jgi:HD-like signal output (HDOD) protein
MSLATLSSAGLRDKALEAMSKLPPFSPVLNKLMASLTDEDISFAELAGVIEKTPSCRVGPAGGQFRRSMPAVAR